MIARRIVAPGLMAAVVCATATTGFGELMGYFPLNEVSNPSAGTTVVDASGKGHNGLTDSDADPEIGPLTGIASVNADLYGTAFNFNSASTDLNFVDIFPSPAFTFLTRDGALSYAAWIKPDATQFHARPTFIGTNGSTYDFRIVPAGENWSLLLESGTPTSPPGYTSTLSVIPSNVWTHVAVTKSAYDSTAGTADVRFYVNGKLAETGTVPRAQSTSSTRRLFLATGSLTDQYYSGGIDEVRVYNEMLDENSIARLAIRQPGDFDLDGDVDGADFGAWQTGFPNSTEATLAQGDADGDGDVDGADFVVWQTNFPFSPVPATTAVPEPGAFVLIVIAVMLIARPSACARMAR